ncbi:MAG: nucleoid-structuring protein H-NS [Marinoscillum sp.]|uniref:nucleoid-structuring protein H-NS n=1 Tax=Marinoscillum sp. TaxID=2024838 RepID=UPI003301EA67
MRHKKMNFSLINTTLLLALIVGFSACKNKKKVAEVSDPQEVRAQIEEELAEDQPEELEEPERIATKEPNKSQKLENYFTAIANAPSATSANGSISEALTMFGRPDAPVLIVIYRKDGTADYDEPTTIKKYLEYLKDTGNNKAKVEEMVLDDYGKIKELVLKK